MSVNIGRRVRRTTNSARRLLDLARSPELYPQCKVVEAFWWTTVRNFGDELGPWILNKYGIASILRRPNYAELVSAGSILHTLPHNFGGVIWGTGSIDGRPTRLPRATVLALRGKLTQAALGQPPATVLGDPGLLASRHIPRPRGRTTLGVVAHYAHRTSAAFQSLQRRNPGDVQIIDVRRRPADVIEEIAACHAILTSSLHGLIIADSFGIPAGWVLERPTLTGGEFKFRDHESVVSPDHPRRLICDTETSVSALLRQLTPADGSRVAASIDALHRSALVLAEGLPRTAAARTVWLRQLQSPVAKW